MGEWRQDRRGNIYLLRVDLGSNDMPLMEVTANLAEYEHSEALDELYDDHDECHIWAEVHADWVEDDDHWTLENFCVMHYEINGEFLTRSMAQRYMTENQLAELDGLILSLADDEECITEALC